ncbi:UNVERIFIED_CONTAM: hypothetical protein GTU68_053989 [Idotea baltica]|nr:hypothetical protein [Idotea baltica]
MQSKVKQRKRQEADSKPGKSNGNMKEGRTQKKENTAELPTFGIDYKRIIIRCVVIIGLIIIVSFTHHENLETFASQKEEFQKKEVTIQCSSDYASEINKFPGCVPKRCGRFVSDYVVSLSEVQALMIIAQKGLGMGGSGGGASILDLHSGALSKGDTFINIYAVDKTHKVISKEDLKIYSHIKDKIKSAIVSQFGLESSSLYLTHPTFFSRITSLPAQTIHDEYWHPHVDKETYKSFHYTSLLYLTDYGHHFKGGRFVFVDKDANRTVEPKVGRLSAFTSGSENLHYVEQVTSGTRYAITVSFTCDPSQSIQDPQIP